MTQTKQSQTPLVDIVLDACNRNKTDKITFGVFCAMQLTGMIDTDEHFENYEGQLVKDYLKLYVDEDVGYQSPQDDVSCLIARGGNYWFRKQ